MSDVDRLIADARAPETLRALLRAAATDRPTTAELANLTHRLEPLLRPAALPANSSALVRSLLTTRALIVAVVVVVAGAGIVGVVVSRSSSRSFSIAAAPAKPTAPPPLPPPPPPPPPPRVPELAAVTPPQPDHQVIVVHPGPRVTSGKSLPPPRSSRPIGTRGSTDLPASRESSQPTEVALLEQARKALQDGDAAHALDLASEHQRHFADGILVEEREALAIEALVKLGRVDPARSRWTTFASSYPRSNYRGRLQRMIDSLAH